MAVSKDHWDLLRFLWVDDIHKDDPQLVIRRFARVVFGVNSSSFLLNATIRHHMNTYRTVGPSFVEEVLRSLYVDDLALSKPDSESTYDFYLKLNERLYKGGFNMRKWKTNDQDLQRKMESQSAGEKLLPSAEIHSEDQSILKSQLQSTTASQDIPELLGITWNNVTDQLEFTFESLASYLEERIVTKRVILSTIAKIFDALGDALCFNIYARKVLFGMILSRKR